MFILISKVARRGQFIKKEAFDWSITRSFQCHDKRIAVVSDVEHNLVANDG